MSICIDKLSVKEAILSINHVRALFGLDHIGKFYFFSFSILHFILSYNFPYFFLIGLGPTSSPKKYALLLAELARDRLWNNASLKKLVGGNIVRILREVRLD